MTKSDKKQQKEKKVYVKRLERKMRLEKE